jgi:hypothetical protein
MTRKVQIVEKKTIEPNKFGSIMQKVLEEDKELLGKLSEV